MDSAVEKQFHDHLVSLGFPPDSIIYEPAFKPSVGGRRYRPDFAVLDPKTREPLAIIELKGTLDQSRLQSALQQVRWYTNQLQNPSVRAYLATPSNGSGIFDFYQAGEDGKLKKVDPVFVEAASLASAALASTAGASASASSDWPAGTFCAAAVTADASVSAAAKPYSPARPYPLVNLIAMPEAQSMNPLRRHRRKIVAHVDHVSVSTMLRKADCAGRT